MANSRLKQIKLSPCVLMHIWQVKYLKGSCLFVVNSQEMTVQMLAVAQPNLTETWNCNNFLTQDSAMVSCNVFHVPWKQYQCTRELMWTVKDDPNWLYTFFVIQTCTFYTGHDTFTEFHVKKLWPKCIFLFPVTLLWVICFLVAVFCLFVYLY